MDNIITIDELDDLCSRFIINVPEEERKNVIRICFQVELAHWFYMDFYCKENNRKVCSPKEFASIVFRHVPFLHPFVERLDKIIDEWKEYKYSVPTYGAILLNEDLTHVLLVQSYCSKSSWGFPKGKINKGESSWQCAIREVLEETGFDIREYMDPTLFLEAVINDHTVRLYIIPGISMSQQFTPKTRNEIKSITWFPLADLPATKKEASTKLKSVSFFMVTPFIRKLREWIYDNFGGTPKKAKSKRPRNKSCGDLEYLEFKDYINPTPENKKRGNKKVLMEKAIFDEDAEHPTKGFNLSERQLKTAGALETIGSSQGGLNLSEADVKVRRTLEYVMYQNPNIGSPPVANADDYQSNKKTPNKKIRILKKPDSRSTDNRTSGKDLLLSLFSNKDLTSDVNSPSGSKDSPSSKPRPSKSNEGNSHKMKSREKLAESPQSKSLVEINHDRALSSFARVANKGGTNRNYFLNHSPAAEGQKSKTPANKQNLAFTEIPFTKSFTKNGIKAWSNFKFDRLDIMKRMNG